MSFSIIDDIVYSNEVASISPILTSTLGVSNSITTRQITSSDTQGQVSIGLGASLLGTSSVSIGNNAGGGDYSVNIGNLANNVNNIQSSTFIGYNSGTNATTSVGGNVCIGYQAGYSAFLSETVVIGKQASYYDGGNQRVAIGYQSGYSGQGNSSISIGYQPSFFKSGNNTISIGYQAGFTGQGNNSIAIGYQAGFTAQPANSIILNADSSGILQVPTQSSAFYVNPIRSQAGVGLNVLSWNSSTKEVYLNTSKTFVIDHPLDNNKYLVHACLEGPEAGVYYRGKSEILNGESVEVLLPEYVKTFSDFSVQITTIYNGNEIITYNAGEVVDGKFTVYGPNGKFFWLVHAMRLPVETEPLKCETEVRGEGPYKYIV